MPSERDWDVYQLVRVEQWPTINAAKEFGLSLTSVCQIVQRTANFVAEIAPVPTKEDEPRHLAAGRQLAAARIDFLYAEALSSFRTSQGNEKVIHQEAGHGKSDRATIRRNLGDMHYLLRRRADGDHGQHLAAAAVIVANRTTVLTGCR